MAKLDDDKLVENPYLLPLIEESVIPRIVKEQEAWGRAAEECLKTRNVFAHNECNGTKELLKLCNIVISDLLKFVHKLKENPSTGGQDVKFACIGGQYFNRVSGEPIPNDEPIIIFRARDHHALPLLKDYLSMATDDHHRQAIRERIKEFSAFAQDHPERMKEPGVTHDIRLNDDPA